jgi:hypothetical protein
MVQFSFAREKNMVYIQNAFVFASRFGLKGGTPSIPLLSQNLKGRRMLLTSVPFVNFFIMIGYGFQYFLCLCKKRRALFDLSF